MGERKWCLKIKSVSEGLSVTIFSHALVGLPGYQNLSLKNFYVYGVLLARISIYHVSEEARIGHQIVMSAMNQNLVLWKTKTLKC